MTAVGLLFSFLFGFVPMFFFAYVVYWTDRYEKEPLQLLGGVFLWGSIIAAGSAFLFNTLLGMGIYIFTGSQAFTEISTSTTVAPIIEESFKGLAVLLIFLLFRSEFDSILDGIVYASITAIGFAATENIYYLYTYGFQESGLSGIISLSFIRLILVGWQHPFYTSFIGIGLAVSRLSRLRMIKILAPISGWLVAIAAHSFHNTIAEITSGMNSLLVGILFDWSGWIVMAIFIAWALYREQRWIIAQLKDEVANGLITPAQYRIACSAWAQSLARLRALFARRYRVTNHFYMLTAELAYKKEQVMHLGEQNLYQAEIDRLRFEIGATSPRLGT